MRHNNFSDDIKNSYSTVPQAVDYFKISRNLLMRVAEENNCVIRIGRCVRINTPKLSKILENLY